MSLKKSSAEMKRLKDAFESEAAKLHGTTFSTYFVTQEYPENSRVFSRPNHAVTLWQYYGKLGDDGADTFISDLKTSDLKWGIRGAELSLFGVIEGPACPLFVQLAKRAGCLFSKNEVESLNISLSDEFMNRAKREEGTKTVFSANSNPLAVWLNYLLFFVSVAFPGREKVERVESDPFTLSLLALENLMESASVAKSDRSFSDIDSLTFKVAVSFPGELRKYVSKTVGLLRSALGQDAVFYDFDYQAQLARPDLDVLLQSIYRDRSDLLVVFLDKNYAEKEWCGLEWRAVRDIIKAKQAAKVMLVRFDESKIDGLFSTDGYIDGRRTSSAKLAKYIIERVCVQQAKTPN